MTSPADYDEEYPIIRVPDEFDTDVDLGQPTYERPLELVDTPYPPFKPWHRPRKHYVRVKQWVGAVRSVMGKGAGQEVRYLGLPGSDLLDLALICEECAKSGKTLHYVGFDESLDGDSNGVDLIYRNVRREELRASGVVSPFSVILPDDIFDLSNFASPARQAVRNLSFEIVNLDFCGSLLRGNPGDFGTLYTTLNAVLEIQSGRDAPWVILLTGAFNRSAMTSSGLAAAEQLLRALRSDLRECDDAAEILRAILKLGPDADVPPDFTGDDPAGYALALVVAMSSWICQVGRGHRVAKFKVTNAMGYRLTESATEPEMYSLAVEVSPLPRMVPDPTGLLPAAPEASDRISCKDLEQFCGRAERSIDVDKILLDDKVFSETRTAAALALERAHYKKDDYLKSEFSNRWQPMQE